MSNITDGQRRKQPQYYAYVHVFKYNMFGVYRWITYMQVMMVYSHASCYGLLSCKGIIITTVMICSE